MALGVSGRRCLCFNASYFTGRSGDLFEGLLEHGLEHPARNNVRRGVGRGRSPWTGARNGATIVRGNKSERQSGAFEGRRRHIGPSRTRPWSPRGAASDWPATVTWMSPEADRQSCLALR
jgi:hypothetical protein